LGDAEDMSDFIRPLRWSELPPGWKAIKVGARVSIILAVICFGISLGIQKVVYPRTPDGEHTHPIPVNNHTEYVTENVAWALKASQLLASGFFIVLIGFGSAELYLRQTDVAKRKQAMFEKVIDGVDQ
jgi:hypothetical protein